MYFMYVGTYFCWCRKKTLYTHTYRSTFVPGATYIFRRIPGHVLCCCCSCCCCCCCCVCTHSFRGNSFRGVFASAARCMLLSLLVAASELVLAKESSCCVCARTRSATATMLYRPVLLILYNCVCLLLAVFFVAELRYSYNIRDAGTDQPGIQQAPQLTQHARWFDTHNSNAQRYPSFMVVTPIHHSVTFPGPPFVVQSTSS